MSGARKLARSDSLLWLVLSVVSIACLSVVLGQVLKVLNGHTDYVNTVAVSVDGGKIVSGSRDKTVRIWSSETGEVPELPVCLWACDAWLIGVLCKRYN